ncbi:MAG: tetratricopeptide repeat protein [Phycisphaerales bacterium]
MALGLSIVLSIVACERGEAPSTNAPTKVVDADSREAAIAAIERNLLAQRLDEASIVAEGLVASLPDDASAAAWFARVRVAQSQAAGANSPAREPRLRDAASALDRALQGGIDDDETLALAASVAESLGDHAAAGARWERLAASRPNDPDPALRLALNRWRLGEADDAVARFQAASERWPREPMVAAAYGEFLLERGEAAAGLAKFAEARSLDPDSIALRVREGNWLRRLGRAEESIALLTALSRSDQATLAVTRETAAAWKALGRSDRAASAWEVCLRTDPASADSTEAMLGAADAWLAAGDRARAKSWLDRVAANDPDHPDLVALEARWREAGEQR